MYTLSKATDVMFIYIWLSCKLCCENAVLSAHKAPEEGDTDLERLPTIAGLNALINHFSFEQSHQHLDTSLHKYKSKENAYFVKYSSL